MIPIPDALTVVRVALLAALAPLCGTYNGNRKCYWQIQEPDPDTGTLAPLPIIVFQSQDGGGQDASFLGLGGWEGEITIRALALTLADAEAQIASVPAALEALANPVGYTIRATFLRPLALSPKDLVYTAAQIYRIQLYRS